MEFRKPKMDEKPNDGLIAGHDWKIFPVLHKRYLFADVESFYLYDLYTSSGNVDENVFAYSNVHQDERGLVLYHNRFADTKGWIKTSAAYLDKRTGDLRQKSLAEALGLPFEGFVIFKDYVTHMEYIRSCDELWQKGLYVELHAYQHHVFMDWRFVDDEKWQSIHNALYGAGVESMQGKWNEMFGIKEEGVEELVNSKKPRKKKATKKKTGVKKEGRGKKVAAKKPAAKKTSSKKKPVRMKTTTTKSTSADKKTTVKKSTAKKSSTRQVSIEAKKVPAKKKPAAKTTLPKPVSNVKTSVSKTKSSAKKAVQETKKPVVRTATSKSEKTTTKKPGTTSKTGTKKVTTKTNSGRKTTGQSTAKKSTKRQ